MCGTTVVVCRLTPLFVTNLLAKTCSCYVALDSLRFHKAIQERLPVDLMLLFCLFVLVTAVKWRQDRASLVRFRSSPPAASLGQVYLCQQQRRPASDRRPRPWRVDRLGVVNARARLTCCSDLLISFAPSALGSSTTWS